MKKWMLILFLSLCNLTNCLIPDGPKTHVMMQALSRGVLKSFDNDDSTFFHKDTYFFVLKGSTENISLLPVACIGSHPTGREIILMDPESSPLLNQKVQEFVETLTPEPTPLSVFLQRLVDFVREEVFDEDACTEEAVDHFIDQWTMSSVRRLSDFTATKQGDMIPVIPIDDFIQAKKGVCRHLSLVTAYFLDKLIQDHQLLPAGQAHYVRDMVRTRHGMGGHAWTLYTSQDRSECWHVDPLWNVIEDCQDPRGINALINDYGPKAIEHEVSRFLIQVK